MGSDPGLKIEYLALEDPAFAGMLAYAGASSIDAAERRDLTGIEPVMPDAFYPGVDIRCEAYPCRLGDGFAFGILRGLEDTAAGRVEFWTRRADQMAIVALALGLPGDWFDWQTELDPETDRPRRVLSQDDNGNRFELARFADEGDAALYARLWDERTGAHKQTAFVSRGPDGKISS